MSAATEARPSVETLDICRKNSSRRSTGPQTAVSVNPCNLRSPNHFELQEATSHDFGASHAWISIGMQTVQAVTFGVRTHALFVTGHAFSTFPERDNHVPSQADYVLHLANFRDVLFTRHGNDGHRAWGCFHHGPGRRGLRSARCLRNPFRHDKQRKRIG
jgi:hypothetical protein